MRVYLPLRAGELAGVVRGSVLPGRAAYGVTPRMRADEPAADEEDLEFDAMCAALDAAADLPGEGRRVVAAADLASDLEAAGEAAESALGEAPEIPLELVVSFHVEEAPGVAGEGYDALLWYDVTELAELVAELG